MPDRITHTSESANIDKHEAKEIEPQTNSQSHPPTSADKDVRYFRHKGIKIKFEQIEKVLNECELVNKAFLLSQEDMDGARKLVAYIVSDGRYDEGLIVEYMTRKVPHYMIPDLWVCVEKLPLTRDGLVDRLALPNPMIKEAVREDPVAPATETEIRLADIIQNILGLQSISVNDNFFRLGGNSMQALRVIAAIRREFDFDLDIKYFFIYPTITQLAVHIQSLSDKDSAENEQSKDNGNYGLYDGVSSSIVPIKNGNSHVPLYIVCGGGGTAFTFEKFAWMLDKEQSVYALQQPSFIAELQNFPHSIEGIADRYLKEILVSNPNGPYALSGHCIGGAIALEMARKLKMMGKEIKLLAMFDVILTVKNISRSKPVKKIKNIPVLIRKATQKAYLKVDFETYLLSKYPKDAIDYKLKSLKSLLNKIYPFQQENIELAVFKKFEQKLENAFENYLINKYDGDLLVFYARDHYHFTDKNRQIEFRKLILEEETKNRWKEYAESVTFYEIEGEHSTIFESNNFANLVQQHLNE